MTDLAAEPIRLDPSRRYIDLARLGKTDWRSGLKGLVRIATYGAAGILVGSVVGVLPVVIAVGGNKTELASFNPAIMLFVGVVATLALMKGTQHAVVLSQRRPFWSVIGPTRGLAIGHVIIGIMLALAAEILAAATISRMSVWSAIWLNFPVSGIALLSAGANILFVVIQATSEELIFRGWLTQSLGQAIRSRFLLVLLVALLFALGHGFSHGILALPYFMLMSLGFSILSLRDGRLELAIGAHIAHNCLSVTMPPKGELPSLFVGSHGMLGPLTLAESGIELVLVCGFAELLRRYGWLSPSAGQGTAPPPEYP